MDRVRSGKLPWQSIDALHRMILDGLLREFGFRLNESEKRDLNNAWHRLTPWADSVKGLTRLKRRFVIGTLSNGNVALLVDMAKHGGLPWDCVLSAELFHHYKPDPEAYLGAAAILGLAPREGMLVAAHQNDLAVDARRAQALHCPHDRNAERILKKVVHGAGPVAERALGHPGKADC